MGNRFNDWFRQAEADLKHSRNSLEAGDYDWACFSSQQAAEKAVKALHEKRGMEAWGHTVTILLGDLKPLLQVPDDLIQSAKVLDKHYIPTRYPNGLPGAVPYEVYTAEQTRDALATCEQVIALAKGRLPKDAGPDGQ